MTRSAKSQQLRVQLKSLDSALVPGSSRGAANPLAIKVTFGEDRVHGESY